MRNFFIVSMELPDSSNVLCQAGNYGKSINCYYYFSVQSDLKLVKDNECIVLNLLINM